MEEESKEKTRDILYIPQGIKTKVEIFDGFGKEELIQSIIAVVAIAVFDLFIFFITRGVVLCIVILLSGIAGSIMMLTKDQNNLSVVDQIKLMLRFSRSQKKYPYITYDEWERR